MTTRNKKTPKETIQNKKTKGKGCHYGSQKSSKKPQKYPQPGGFCRFGCHSGSLYYFVGGLDYPS